MAPRPRRPPGPPSQPGPRPPRALRRPGPGAAGDTRGRRRDRRTVQVGADLGLRHIPDAAAHGAQDRRRRAALVYRGDRDEQQAGDAERRQAHRERSAHGITRTSRMPPRDGASRPAGAGPHPRASAHSRAAGPGSASPGSRREEPGGPACRSAHVATRRDEGLGGGTLGIPERTVDEGCDEHRVVAGVVSGDVVREVITPARRAVAAAGSPGARAPSRAASSAVSRKSRGRDGVGRPAVAVDRATRSAWSAAQSAHDAISASAA